jgi:hypothetical protein
MIVNITACMQYLEIGSHSKTGRGKCKHLDKGVFGGYICKLGNQIDFVTPRIGKEYENCKDKEVSKSA